MYQRYRICPVLERASSDARREIEAFHSIGEAVEAQTQSAQDSSHGDVPPRIFWTVYGVNPPSHDVCTEDAIADRDTEAAVLDLLEGMVGRVTSDLHSHAPGYFVPARRPTLPEDGDKDTLTEVSLILKLDLALLRWQKSVLVEMGAGSLVSSEQEEAVEGILNPLDFIQDTLSDQGLASEWEISGTQ